MAKEQKNKIKVLFNGGTEPVEIFFADSAFVKAQQKVRHFIEFNKGKFEWLEVYSRNYSCFGELWKKVESYRRKPNAID